MKLFDEIFLYKCPICNVIMHKDNPYYCQSIDHQYNRCIIRLYLENMAVKFEYTGNVSILLNNDVKFFNINMEDEKNIIKNLYQIVESFKNNMVFL